MSVLIVSPGLFTTVQDLGRWGWQAHGVPVSGAMDARSHRRANDLVGNDVSCATLEVTIIGPELAFERSTRVAVSGATFSLALNGREAEQDVAHDVSAGDVLTFGQRQRGARAYVAVAGGFDVPMVLGSRSTHVRSRLGGFEGRSLRVGDRLPIGVAGAVMRTNDAGEHATRSTYGVPDGGARVRVLPGPHVSWLHEDSRQLLVSTRYRLSAHSDRMGYRLNGPPLGMATETLLSTATIAGGVQLPPGGEPILLMADRQTTGGYPIVAAVAADDLDAAGQLAPGDWIAFEWR
jgi:antagonist of KipI